MMLIQIFKNSLQISLNKTYFGIIAKKFFVIRHLQLHLRCVHIRNKKEANELAHWKSDELFSNDMALMPQKNALKSYYGNAAAE